MKAFAISLVVALMFIGIDTEDWLHSKWAIIVAGASVYMASRIWNIDRLMGLAVGYCMLNGVWFSLMPYNYTAAMEPVDQMVLQLSGVQGLVYIFALVWLIGALEPILKHAWIVATFASVWLLVSAALGWHIKGPSLNPSLSATLVALMYPFIMEKAKPRRAAGAMLWAIPLAAVWMAHGQISVIALALGLVAYYASASDRLWTLGVACVAGLGALLAIVNANANAVVAAFSGRLEFWAETISFMQANGFMRVLFGNGMGSMYAFGPVIQDGSPHKFQGGVTLLTAHNDILQLAFEFGFVGLALWAAVYFTFLWSSRRTPWLFAFFVILGVVSFGNFPHHLGIEALVIGCMYSKAKE